MNFSDRLLDMPLAKKFSLLLRVTLGRADVEAHRVRMFSFCRPVIESGSPFNS
jgi:hypothetical protein